MLFAPEFYRVLVEGSKGAFDPVWLLGLMASESSLDPTAYNKNGGAQGLSQLMPQTLRNLGVAVDGFRHLPPEVQIKTTLAYFKEWQTRFKLTGWDSRAQMYLINFMPALLPVATAPDSIIVSKDRSPVIYAANAGLDANKDNRISLAELDIAIVHAINGYSKARYQQACGELASYLLSAVPGATLRYQTWKACQEELKRRGLYTGDIDGLPGPKTMAAVSSILVETGKA